MLGNAAILVNPRNADKDLTETIEEYDELRKIWMRYKSPCSKEECPIC
jgi:hypothetical protein